ncbi:MAG: mandelate racemase/muconate lactonizing enzyme family protein [Spirochaetales bacterium]|uniref:Mandelate racemase/muconate lactonizing enzyme family protein n=1 Tax=Candidatus Thalassospirochaeta sargassi TaxID=3119039 RepID=A0AAJ1ICN1_9SPIO|nr:mandelate racemase/muconate lactonizing enzyme family protein [Spirochaetales bacterium]
MNISDSTHDISEIAFVIAEITLESGVKGQGYLLSFHYNPNAIIGALKDIKDFVNGYEVNETLKLADDLSKEMEYFGHNGINKWALAVVNVAMWDAWGKTLDQPVWKLLGGSYKAVPVYGSGGWLSYSEKELIDEVTNYKKRGFQAVKIKVGSPEVEQDIERLRKVREAVGNDIKIMMDANQGMDLPSAMKLSLKASALNIYWFEEPIVHTDFAGYEILRNKTDISLAMGEREYDCEPLKELIRRNALDLWQPDIIRIGGVDEWRRSAILASSYNVPVLPHYYKDYDVPLLTTVDKVYGSESFDWIDGIIDNQLSVEDGFTYPREGAGWGFNFLEKEMTEV